jgi:hypothetical protein
LAAINASISLGWCPKNPNHPAYRRAQDTFCPDPWVKQYFLPLEDLDTGALAIFVTGSEGGQEAIGRLCQIYARGSRKGLPIVELAADSYKSKRYGRIEIPDRRVIGWQPPPDAVGHDSNGIGPGPNLSAEIPY